MEASDILSEMLVEIDYIYGLSELESLRLSHEFVAGFGEFTSIKTGELYMAESWNDADKILPPCNVIVRVKITNGYEDFDFVNEPVDRSAPFQHFLVEKWRYATREELNMILANIWRTATGKR